MIKKITPVEKRAKDLKKKTEKHVQIAKKIYEKIPGFIRHQEDSI